MPTATKQRVKLPNGQIREFRVKSLRRGEIDPQPAAAPQPPASEQKPAAGKSQK